jgi:hypothetical protein
MVIATIRKSSDSGLPESLEHPQLTKQKARLQEDHAAEIKGSIVGLAMFCLLCLGIHTICNHYLER